ncbi:protocadherin Fat 4 isoform X2 [Hydra vulgaris]|uniref:Protocadherin Fat 4 isoform X2 n=1 Tax=Hydra vulgaris TaxID=6087 RepID=A0ABM4C6D9_HYDVU
MKSNGVTSFFVLSLLTTYFTFINNELTGFSGQLTEDIFVPTPVTHRMIPINKWVASNEIFYNNDVFTNRIIKIPKDGLYILTGNIIIKTDESNMFETIWHNELYLNFCKSIKSLRQKTTQTLSLGCFARLRKGETISISIVNKFELNVMSGSSIGLQMVSEIGHILYFSLPIPLPNNTDAKAKFKMKEVFSNFNFYNTLTAFAGMKTVEIPISGIYSLSLNVITKTDKYERNKNNRNGNSRLWLELNSKILESIYIESDIVDTIFIHKTLLLQKNDVITFQYINVELLSGGSYSITRLSEAAEASKGISVLIPEKIFLAETSLVNHFLNFDYLENSVQTMPYFYGQSSFLSHLNQNPSEQLNKNPRLIVKDFGVYLITLQIDISMEVSDIDVILHSVMETEKSEISLSSGLSASFKSARVKNNRFTLNGFLQLRKNSPLYITIKCKDFFSIRNTSYFSITPIKNEILAFFGYVKKAEEDALICKNQWMPLNGIYSHYNNTMSNFLSINHNKFIVPTIGVYLILINALVKSPRTRDGKIHLAIFLKRFNEEKVAIADLQNSLTTESNELWISNIFQLKSGDELELMTKCTEGVQFLDDVKLEIYFLMHVEKSEYFIMKKPTTGSYSDSKSSDWSLPKSILLDLTSGVYYVSLSFLLVHKAIDAEHVILETYVYKNNYENLKYGLYTVLTLNKNNHNEDGFETVNVCGFMELSQSDILYIEVVFTPSFYYKYIKEFSDYQFSAILFSEIHRTSVRFKTIEQNEKVFTFVKNIEPIENLQFTEERGGFKSDSASFLGPYMVVERSMYMMYDVSVQLKNVIGEFALCFRIRPRTNLVFISKKIVSYIKKSIILEAHGVIDLTIGETVQLIVYGEKQDKMILCTRVVWSMVEILPPIPQQSFVSTLKNSTLNILGDYLKFNEDDKSHNFDVVQFHDKNSDVKDSDLNSELTSFYQIRDKLSLVFRCSETLDDLVLNPFQHIYTKASNERNTLWSLLNEPIISLLIIEPKRNVIDLIEITLIKENGENLKLFEGYITGKKTFIYGHMYKDSIQIRKITHENKARPNVGKQTVHLVLMPLKQQSQTDGFSALFLNDKTIEVYNKEVTIGPWVITSLPFFDYSLGFKNNSDVFYVQENGYFLISINIEIDFITRCEVYVMLDESIYFLIGDQQSISYTNMLWLEVGMTIQLILKCSAIEIVTIKKLSSFSLILHASTGTFDILSQYTRIKTNINGKNLNFQTNHTFYCSHSSLLLSDFKWIKDGQVILESKFSRTSVLALSFINQTYNGFYQCIMERGKRVEVTPFSHVQNTDSRSIIALSSTTIYISENTQSPSLLAIATVKTVNSNQKINLKVVSGDQKFYLFPEETNDFSSLYLNGTLDYESKRFYKLKILATFLHDKAVQIEEKDIMVYITNENDNKPTFTDKTTVFFIKENIKIGSRLTSIKVEDEDGNSNFTFHITSGENDQQLFKIIPNTGNIIIDKELDFEKIQAHNLLVSVHDGLHTSFKHIKVVVLDVNDNLPEYLEYIYVVNVTLDTLPGTHLLSLKAVDKDSGMFGELHFSITSGNIPKTFEMMQNDLVLHRKVPAEQNFVLTVELRDGGGLKCEKEAQILVQFIEQHTGSYSIFDASVYSVALVEAFRGEREVIHLSINSGVKLFSLTYEVDTLGKFSSSEFYVNSDGILMTNATIDYETVIEFHVLISACIQVKSGRLCSMAYVAVRVTDINDNYPKFMEETLAISIYEDTPTGDSVTQVSASDKDSMKNGEVYYSLLNHEDTFSIDKLTGVVILIKKLSYSENTEYVLKVMATDQGFPSLSSYCTVVVSILLKLTDIAGAKVSENKRAPQFTNKETKFEVSENSFIGTLVTKMSAVDADENAKLSFSLVEMLNDAPFFSINQKTGIIVTVKELDFEKTKEHNLLVSVHDGLHTSFKHIKVVVLDVNDNLPEYLEYIYVVNVTLDTLPGTHLLSLKAVDKDSGMFGELHFSITSGNIPKTFEMMQNDLVLHRKVPAEQNFILTVELRDGGGLKCEKEAQILVQFIEQHTGSYSIFDASVYSVALVEAFRGEREVIHLSINSGVKLFSLTYEVDTLGKFSSSEFYVNSDGILMTNATIDYETVIEFHVLISACIQVKSGRLCSMAYVAVRVTDINDNYPKFMEETLAISIYEDTPTGDSVTQVSASDKDSMKNGEVYYSLLNHEDTFSIDKLTGVVILIKKLSYSENTEYVLKVMATDQGFPSLSSYCTVVVSILLKLTDIAGAKVSENKRAPQFTNKETKFEVSENSFIGTLVTKMSAVDADENAKLSFSLVEMLNDAPFFSINQKTGIIVTVKELDFEKTKEHNLLVSVHDGLHTSFKHIKVVVLDVNDNLPEYLEYIYVVNVTLDTLPGTHLLSLKAVDKDSGMFGELHFSITSGNIPKTFEMMQNDLVLHRKVPAEQNFVLTVELRDGGGLKCEKEAQILVQFIEQHTGSYSIFDASVYSVALVEAFRGEREVIHLSINSGVKLFSLTYEVDTLGKFSSSEFYVNSDGILMTNATIDYETVIEFHVLISACIQVKSGRLCSMAYVAVRVTDINDNYPKFMEETLAISIYEDTPTGDSVTQVSASDKDSMKNGEVYYSLLNHEDTFSIDKLTGVVILIKKLSYSENTEYVLKVMATDQGFPSLSSYCTVVVSILLKLTDIAGAKVSENKRAPQFTNKETKFEVSENSFIGTLVTKMSAVDADENAKLSFSLVEMLNDAPFFSINQKTGIIVTVKELDFEKTKEHNLLVSVHDGLHTSFKHIKVVVLDVNDNLPEYLEYIYVVNVTLDTLPGTHLLSLKAVDKDSGMFGELHFSITSGNIPKTFEMMQNDLVLHRKVPAEQNFILTVELRDGGGLKCEKEAQILVQFIEQHTGSYSIFDASVYSVALVEAFRGEREVIHLSINSGVKLFSLTYEVDTLGKFSSSEFYVNSDGILMTNATIDYETVIEFHVLISACIQVKSGRLCSMAYVAVRVTDINDNYPKFMEETLAISIYEDTPTGDSVTQVSASDKDSMKNGEVYYSLLNHEDTFSIDKLTGVVILIKKLSYSENTEYVLKVMATDQGFPSLSSYCTVVVSILLKLTDIAGAKVSENKRAPQFTNKETKFEVSENSFIGTLVTKMSAVDADENAKLSFSLVEMLNDAPFFSINQKTGIIVTVKELDFEKTKEHNLLVSVHDGLHTSFKHIKVVVLDVNDNLPEYLEYIYVVNVTLDTLPGTHLLSLKAVDKDSGMFGELHFSITSGNIPKTFEMMQNDLVLHRKVPAEQNFVLTVELRDGGGLKCEKEAQILVQFIEQHTGSYSIFDASVYNVALVEAFRGEREVIHLSINSGVKLFSLTYEVDTLGKFSSSEFYVNSDGILMTNATIDYETVIEFHVLISACIQVKSGRLCSMAYVAVRVTDINDNYPKFMEETLAISIYEDTPTGDSVTQVSASDKDSMKNGEVYYSLLNHEDTFSIDKLTGVVILIKKLSYSENTEYVLKVMATDQGFPSLSSYCTVVVSILLKLTDIAGAKVSENKRAPQFTNKETKFEVSENSFIGTLVTKMSAVDADENAKLSFSLVEMLNDAPFFSINQKTGIIVTVKELDFEKTKEHNLLVSVHDGLHTSFKHIKVVVLDVNDNLPEYLEYIYVVNVTLDTLPGTHLLSLKAVDKDSGMFGELHFSITSGNIPKTFEMMQNDLVLHRKVPAEQNFILTVELRDGGGLKCEKEAQILVQFIEQHTGSYSIFDASVYSVALVEAFRGEREVIHLSINSGVKLFSLTYEVDTLGKFSSSEFYVNSDGILMTNATIDYETVIEFHVLISACIQVKSGRLCSMAYVAVNVTDINDNYPQFLHDIYNVSIYENIYIGDMIMIVIAKDIDGNENGLVSYSLLNFQNTFRIDKSSGKVYLAESLNSKLHEVYKLIVESYDHGTPSLRSNCTVSINVLPKLVSNCDLQENSHHPEIFINFTSKLYLPENSPIGTFLTRIEGFVFDLNQSLTFDLIEFSEDMVFFTINKFSGELVTASVIDYEHIQEHNVIISVHAGFYSTFRRIKIIVIDENDNNPEFLEYDYFSNIDNETSIGTELVMLKAIDKDSVLSQKLTFVITSGNDLNCFGIEINKVILMCPLNYADIFLLHVSVSDSGGRKSNRNAHVTIRVNTESFNSISLLDKFIYKVRILEKVNEESQILKLKFNKKLRKFPMTYKFVTYGKYKSSDFYVSSMGWVTINATVDYEKTKDFYILITVCANYMKYELCGLAYVFINVVDMNDNAPKFSLENIEVVVLESTPIGSMIAQVTATDSDMLNNGEIFYTLWNYTDVFSIDKDTGKIFLLHDLRFFVDKTFNITVEATDNGVPILFSFVKLFLTIKPDTKTTLVSIDSFNNKGPPFFLNSSITFEIDENCPIGTLVGTVKAFDSDKNSKLVYRVVTFSKKHFFKINSSTGDLLTADFIDFEKFQEYYFLVFVEDSLYMSYQEVKVNVIDKNDNKPEFSEYLYEIKISLDTKPGTLLLRLAATDKDSEKYNKLEYKIVSGNIMDYFILNENAIFLHRNINIDQTYELIISVTDEGGLESEKCAKVIISFVDELSHSFSLFDRYIYNASIYTRMFKNTKKDLRIVKLELNSKFENVELIYDINAIGNYENSAFYVNSDKWLMTNVLLDYENSNEFHILVMACASPFQRRLCGLAYISINILENNISEPFYSVKKYIITVQENTLVGQMIARIPAFDTISSPINHKLYYTLTTYNDIFLLDKYGRLFLIGQLNFSLISLYNITIQSTGKKQSDGFTLLVKVEPINLHNQTPRFYYSSFFVKNNWIVVVIVAFLVLAFVSLLLCFKHLRKKKILNSMLKKRPKKENLVELQNILKYFLKPAESIEASIYFSSESLHSAFNSSKFPRKWPVLKSAISSNDLSSKVNGIGSENSKLLNNIQKNDFSKTGFIKSKKPNLLDLALSNSRMNNGLPHQYRTNNFPLPNTFYGSPKQYTANGISSNQKLHAAQAIINKEKYIFKNGIQLIDIFDKIEEFEC